MDGKERLSSNSQNSSDYLQQKVVIRILYFEITFLQVSCNTVAYIHPWIQKT